MLNEKQKKTISKFLSLILRHQPEKINLQLDEYGWAEVQQLIEKSNHYGMKFDLNDLENIVETNTKKRFAFNEDYSKIRASQGHSIAVKHGYENQKPPQYLYHGTAKQNFASILEHGIQKQSRQHVHLSTDYNTAKQVGSRHGKPFILKIESLKMFEDNYAFYLSDNGVWLTNEVPQRYISTE